MMNNTNIEFWIDRKDNSIHQPSFQLINKLKKIPYNEVRMNAHPVNSWILWVAAASFVGFMFFNLSYFKNDSTQSNSLDAYFPITTAY